jgi:hypothetical protein
MEFVAIHYGIGIDPTDLDSHYDPMMAAKVRSFVPC